MASHHHHSNHHHHTTTCCCCCSGGGGSSCCSSNPSPPTLPTTAAADPLLQALAAHLLQSQTTTQHLYSKQYLKSQQIPQQQQEQFHHHKQQQQAQAVLQSLLRRVAALESSLPHVSPPPPLRTTPPPPPKPSLRDLAARTIQGRFRLYLVRRSQTLRHLKHLAAVRSHLANLKSSLPEEDHLSPKALSQKAMDLLLQLDSIQSGDPMIREGKRSISRELVRLLEFADRVSVRKQELRLNAMEIAENGSERRTLTEKSNRELREAGVLSRVCEEDEEASIPRSMASILKRQVPSSKPVKRVRFAENLEEYRFFADTEEHDFDQTPFMEELLREAEGIEGFSRVSEDDMKAHWQAQGLHLHQISDDNQNPGGSVDSRDEHRMGGYQNGSSHLGLSAPMPVQMEARRIDDSKKKNVVIAP